MAHKKFGESESRPHSSPDPSCGRKFSRGKTKNPFPQKTVFRFAESVLKPHELPEYLEGRTPKEKHPFLFQEKIHLRQIRNARSVFSFGVAGVLASAWGFNTDSTDFPPAGGVWGGMRAGFGLGFSDFKNFRQSFFSLFYFT